MNVTSPAEEATMPHPDATMTSAESQSHLMPVLLKKLSEEATQKEKDVRTASLSLQDRHPQVELLQIFWPFRRNGSRETWTAERRNNSNDIDKAVFHQGGGFLPYGGKLGPPCGVMR